MLTKRLSIQRFLFAAIITVFFCCFSCFAQSDSLARVTFLDVGQGDSILIRTKDKTILIDAGDDRFDTATKVLIPYLKKAGIAKIDMAVISHPHRDHFGGFIDLIQEIEIGEFVYSCGFLSGDGGESFSGDSQLYQKLLTIINEKKIPYNRAKVGSDLNWGSGVQTEVLFVSELERRSPSEGNASDTLPPAVKFSANDESLVVKMNAGKVSYLFSGDAEKNTEEKIVREYREKLKCTILKSPHHGSKTSSGFPFMDVVKPEYAVISVGKDNHFGHPNQETMDKYAFHKTRVFRTDQDGTVETITDGETVKFTSNQSPLEIVERPKVISLTQNSITLQWKTNKDSNTQIKYGPADYSSSKLIQNSAKIHTITITGLKPDTNYQYIIFSRDSRQVEQLVSDTGEFKTPSAEGDALPVIHKLFVSKSALYVKNPFLVTSCLKNSATQDISGLSLEVYHDTMTPENMIGSKDGITIPAGKASKFDFETNISWVGTVEIIAVLKKDSKIIDTSSINVEINSRLILVDCAHGNKDYYMGVFSGMKMDLGKKLGLEFKSISESRALASSTLKNVFAVIIPHPEKQFSPDEITLFRNYVAAGGSLLMYCKADFGNKSNPAFLNEILKAAGSLIRFNDDEVFDPTDNIGYLWGIFIKNFPSPLTKGVSKLLVRGCCTLINAKNEGLIASKNLHLLAVGDDDTYNLSNDGLDDAYVYASHTPVLPVPIAACEDLGTGRVACVGEPLYNDRLYSSNSSLNTPEFNLAVIEWLISSKNKNLRELVAAASELESVEDPESRSYRFESIKSRTLEVVSECLADDCRETLVDAFTGQKGAPVETLRDEIKSMLEFKKIHLEGNPIDF
ncbi:MAG: MBL fold metallo-hydrolase [Candidatus Riflebacteria bacterium]|nr:MBL fold metallo-hydrolase [Candidatus Riflebacteria bacterium]